MSTEHDWWPLQTRRDWISTTDRCRRCRARLRLAPAGRILYSDDAGRTYVELAREPKCKIADNPPAREK